MRVNRGGSDEEVGLRSSGVARFLGAFVQNFGAR